jgi:hypothetical protein
MKITEFTKKISELEGGEEELTVAQILEVIKITNKLTNGVLYSVIQLMPVEYSNV